MRLTRDKESWNTRYDKPELINGVVPSDFLAENRSLLPETGTALDLAAGEGRNAIFLAELGLEVLAVDISVRGLSKCQRVVRERHLRVHPAVLDLTSFAIPSGYFDVIINFNYLQRDLAPQIVEGLKPGGVLIFETLSMGHLRHQPDFNPEYLLKPGELLQLFRTLHLIKYRETDPADVANTKSRAGIVAKRGPSTDLMEVG